MRRKSDKWKLIEKRGTGMGSEYTPWIKIHEFGSKGRAHRIIGWKTNRIHHFMSDLEVYYFLLKQWEDNVIDIREQYPLLPLEATLLISNSYGITHPPKNKTLDSEKTVMTTDFLITCQDGYSRKHYAVAIKPSKDLTNVRTKEKLLIEKEYWRREGVHWEIITENQINITKAKNLKMMYKEYYWDKTHFYKPDEVRFLVELLKKELNINNMIPLLAVRQLENILGWKKGEGINFLQYLILRKEVHCDLDKKWDMSKLRISI